MTENTTTQRRTAGSSNDVAAASTPSSSNSPPVSAEGGSSSFASAVTMMPFRILSKTPAILTILLRVLLWPLLKLLNAAFPPKEYDGVNNSSASDRAAKVFVTMLQKHISTVRPVLTDQGGSNENQEHYVEPICPFSPRGYFATLSEITSRTPLARPLLLLYLHSPLHADGTKFIRDYLCHPQLLQLLNNNNSINRGSVACFGANIHTADGQKLREMMGVTSFPFIALLSVKSSGSSSTNRNNNVTMELLLRMEGLQLFKISPSQIITYLNTSISRHTEVLAAEEARRLQREQEQRLREEQDREYQEALLADQMREIERQEAAEQERKEREELEEAEWLKKNNEETRLEDAKAIMERAGAEPPLGLKQGVTRLRFALPNGKKVERRFLSTDMIEIVRAFLVLYFHEQGIGIRNFGLTTNFPKKSFRNEQNKLSLEEAGLAPQAMVMVQDLDS